MKEDSFNYDWSGWCLNDNLYGKDFDLAARKRMIKNSELLLPLLQRYTLGKAVIEAGPFFNPLITPERFPVLQNIIFMDNDTFVLKYLAEKYQPFPQVLVKASDLNKVDNQDIPEKADSIIVSHLLNYVNYQHFICVAKEILNAEGLLFINHSTDYGLPIFFSRHRPKSTEELINSVTEAGFLVLEKIIVPSSNIKHQPKERLLLVARKVNRG